MTESLARRRRDLSDEIERAGHRRLDDARSAAESPIVCASATSLPGAARGARRSACCDGLEIATGARQEQTADLAVSTMLLSRASSVGASDFRLVRPFRRLPRIRLHRQSSESVRRYARCVSDRRRRSVAAKLRRHSVGARCELRARILAIRRACHVDRGEHPMHNAALSILRRRKRNAHAHLAHPREDRSHPDPRGASPSSASATPSASTTRSSKARRSASRSSRASCSSATAPACAARSPSAR